MFHGVEADKGTCATQSCLAVHGNSAVVRVGEVGLAALEELVNDCIGRSRTISEDHVLMIDTLA